MNATQIPWAPGQPYYQHFWVDGTPCLVEDKRACWELKTTSKGKSVVVDLSFQDTALLHLIFQAEVWRLNFSRQYTFTRALIAQLRADLGRDKEIATLSGRQALVKAAMERVDWKSLPTPTSAFKTMVRAQPVQSSPASVAESDPALVKILDKLTDVVSRPVEVDLKGATDNAATVEDLEALFLAIVREFSKVAPDKRDLEIAWPDGRKTTIEHLSRGDVAIRFPDGRRTTLRRRN